jgi:hypothetical protein
MTKRTIKGTFAIQTTPHEPLPLLAGASVGRMTFSKQFSGELAGESVVQMLGHMNMATKSGGYVAIEHIAGSLGGKRGSFLLQHSSLMSRGAPSQTIVVIPDSGTEALTGLTGAMTIDIVDKVHHYTFEFSLPE